MRLSVQLYTLRDELAADVPGTLEQVRATGLEYVELAGWFGRSVDEWQRMLDDLGLKANGMHVGLDVLDLDYATQVGALKQLGAKYAIIPWLSSDQRSDWEKLGASLQVLGEKVARDGLQLAYHNHDFEFLDGGLERLFTSCDAAIVKSELDLAWVQIGGQSPTAWIHKLADRLPLVHLKDYDPTVDPQWVPAGQGVVNWSEVVPACEQVGVEFGVIELDAFAGAPLDAVQQSVAFFQSMGLG